MLNSFQHFQFPNPSLSQLVNGQICFAESDLYRSNYVDFMKEAYFFPVCPKVGQYPGPSTRRSTTTQYDYLVLLL